MSTRQPERFARRDSLWCEDIVQTSMDPVPTAAHRETDNVPLMPLPGQWPPVGVDHQRESLPVATNALVRRAETSTHAPAQHQTWLEKPENEGQIRASAWATYRKVQPEQLVAALETRTTANIDESCCASAAFEPFSVAMDSWYPDSSSR